MEANSGRGRAELVRAPEGEEPGVRGTWVLGHCVLFPAVLDV